MAGLDSGACIGKEKAEPAVALGCTRRTRPRLRSGDAARLVAVHAPSLVARLECFIRSRLIAPRRRVWQTSERCLPPIGFAPRTRRRPRLRWSLVRPAPTRRASRRESTSCSFRRAPGFAGRVNRVGARGSSIARPGAVSDASPPTECALRFLGEDARLDPERRLYAICVSDREKCGRPRLPTPRRHSSAPSCTFQKVTGTSSCTMW